MRMSVGWLTSMSGRDTGSTPVAPPYAVGILVDETTEVERNETTGLYAP